MSEQLNKKKGKFVRNFWVIISSILVMLGGIWLFAVSTVQNSINAMFYRNNIYVEEYSYSIDQQSNRMFTIDLIAVNNSANRVDIKITSGTIRIEQGYKYDLMQSNTWEYIINANKTYVFIGNFTLPSSDFFALYTLGHAVYMEITLEVTVHSKILWVEKQETRTYNTAALEMNFMDFIINPETTNSLSAI